MEALRLEQIAGWCGGKLVRGDSRALALRVCTDSRSARTGDCFIALKGERHDAHTFLSEAARAGAVAAIVRRGIAEPSGKCAFIEVDDTLAGLQRLAGNYRDGLKLKVVGVTGSNGKTTTKDLCASVLAQKFSVAKTSGNFNNHIGLPLSLLAANAAHEIGVFELGMNHEGEIAGLASLAKPDAAIITNIGRAHIEFLGSRSAIAREKGALVESLGKSGVGVLNADDDWSASIAERCQGRVVTTGIRRVADVRARAVEIGVSAKFTLCFRETREEARVKLPMLGRHQIYNALQAAAVGRIFNMKIEDIVAGLEKFKAPEMRMQLEQIGDVRIFNDAYNANPDSMEAALAAFRHVRASGRKIVVLGDMMELGEHTQAAHEEVGQMLGEEGGVKVVVTVGASARVIGKTAIRNGLEEALVVAFDTAEDAAKFLKMESRAGDCILLKGSRRVGLERIAQALREHAQQRGVAAESEAEMATVHR